MTEETLSGNNPSLEQIAELVSKENKELKDRLDTAYKMQHTLRMS